MSPHTRQGKLKPETPQVSQRKTGMRRKCRVQKILEEAVGYPGARHYGNPSRSFKGPAFRKGHTVCQEDICHLQRLGKNHLYVIDLAADEIHENEAAAILAAPLPVTGSAGRTSLEKERSICRQGWTFARQHRCTRGLQPGGRGHVRHPPQPYPGAKGPTGGGYAGDPAHHEACIH